MFLSLRSTGQVVCLRHNIFLGHPETVKLDHDGVALLGHRAPENLNVYAHVHNHGIGLSCDIIG